MRYECDDAAFEGDFVEFSDSFSRAQQRALWAAAGEDEAAFLELLRPKIVSLHLSCLDGAPPITKPDDLTPERTEAMDVRLYGWFGVVWATHLRGLRDLGNELGRNSSAISVALQTTALPSRNHS
jgi:hypothetical protein